MSSADDPRDTPGRLLGAAREVFARQGLGEARMEDVAAAAGVSRAALYYHFHSKNDLLRALVNDRMEEFGRQLTAALADRPVEAMVGVTLRFFVDNHDIVRLLVAALPTGADVPDLVTRHRTQIVQPVRERLRRGIADGSVRRLDPDITAEALLGMVRTAVFGHRGDERDLHHLQTELTDLVRHAITP